MSAPTYVTYTVLIASICMLMVLLVGLKLAIDRAGWNETERVSTSRTASAAFIVWYALALVLAWAEFFRGAADRLRADSPDGRGRALAAVSGQAGHLSICRHQRRLQRGCG